MFVLVFVIMYGNCELTAFTIKSSRKSADFVKKNLFLHSRFLIRKSYFSDNDTQNDTQNSLSERQKKIVEILRKDNRVSIEELTSILSISESTVIRDIRKIRKFMSIKWVGPSKGGHWEVVE